MNKNFYPLKHWFLALAIGTLFPLLSVNQYKLEFELYGAYFLFLSVSVLYFIPTFIVYYFLYLQLLKVNTSSTVKKIILNCFGILWVIIILSILIGTDDMSFFIDLIIGYSLAIIISSFFTRWNPKINSLNLNKN